MGSMTYDAAQRPRSGAPRLALPGASRTRRGRRDRPSGLNGDHDMRTRRNIPMLALAAFAFAACDDISGSDFQGDTAATLSFAVAPAASTAETTWLGSRLAGVIVTDAAG